MGPFLTVLVCRVFLSSWFLHLILLWSQTYWLCLENTGGPSFNSILILKLKEGVKAVCGVWGDAFKPFHISWFPWLLLKPRQC